MIKQHKGSSLYGKSSTSGNRQKHRKGKKSKAEKGISGKYIFPTFHTYLKDKSITFPFSLSHSFWKTKTNRKSEFSRAFSSKAK